MQPHEVEAAQERVIEYYEKTPGATFTAACAYAKLPASTGYWMRRKYPAFDRAVKEARLIADDMGGDFAESRLMSAIARDELTAIMFYLSTKHKHRGYIKRVDNVSVFVPGQVTTVDQNIVQNLLQDMRDGTIEITD